jgi:phage terminase small subunit
MNLPKRLTEMQQKFAELLVFNEGRKTPTECAVEAGYDKDSAHVRASELRNPNKYPGVVKYIGELREEIQKKYEITFEKHVAELAKLRDSSRDKGAWSAAINAEVARGKAAGLYVEQKIIRTGKLEDMSEKELEAKMKQLIEDNKGLIVEADFDIVNEKQPEEKQEQIIQE